MKEMNTSANSLYRLASLSMHTHTHTHTASTLVREVILKGLRQDSLGWKGRSPDEFCLKVCGKDEYMDK